MANSEEAPPAEVAAPQPEYVTLGKLSFPASARKVVKSAEVFVFQGLYNQKTTVTVKRAKKHLKVIEKERLLELSHPNIVRYYTTEADDEF